MDFSFRKDGITSLISEEDLGVLESLASLAESVGVCSSFFGVTSGTEDSG